MARVTRTGAVLDTGGILIGTGPNDQTSPAVTHGDSNYFVVWLDFQDFASLGAARVSNTGVVLDSGLVVSALAEGEDNTAVTFDGTDYIAA